MGKHIWKRIKNPRKVMALEERLVNISKLYRQGYCQSDIAKMLGCCQSSISAALREIHRRYEEAQIGTKKAMVQEQLAKLADVRVQAWEAWELSRGIYKKKVVEYGLGKPSEDDGSVADSLRRIRVIISSEGRLPENAYLTTILKTFEAERALLGLDAPKASEPVRVDIFDWKVLLSGALSVDPKSIEATGLDNLIITKSTPDALPSETEESADMKQEGQEP